MLKKKRNTCSICQGANPHCPNCRGQQMQGMLGAIAQAAAQEQREAGTLGDPACPDCGHPMSSHGHVGAAPKGSKNPWAQYPINPTQAMAKQWGAMKLGKAPRSSGNCTPVSVQAHPTAYYRVSGGEFPAQVAVKFGRKPDDYVKLMGANVGWWTPGFSVTGPGSCVMNGWKDGILIRVPSDWPRSLTAQAWSAVKMGIVIVGAANSWEYWAPVDWNSMKGNTAFWMYGDGIARSSLGTSKLTNLPKDQRYAIQQAVFARWSDPAAPALEYFKVVELLDDGNLKAIDDPAFFRWMASQIFKFGK